jgi:hypothetical protein
MLISILGTRGQNNMRFENEERWEQVASWEREEICRKLPPPSARGS